MFSLVKAIISGAKINEKEKTSGNIETLAMFRSVKFCKDKYKKIRLDDTTKKSK